MNLTKTIEGCQSADLARHRPEAFQSTISDRVPVTGAAADDDKGAALVEFAVIAPLLFLLLFGVLEFARVISAYTTVWTGAREGARYAITSAESDVSPGVPRYRDCAGLLAAVQAKAVTTSISGSDVSAIWRDGAGTIVADCDGSDAAYPNPAMTSGGTWAIDLESGSTVSVTVSGTFNGAAPIISTFLSGLVLDSTQQRTIYRGVLGG